MHGGWSGWSSWSRCGNTCGGGTRERNRSCTNPPPYFGGKGCGPHHYESKECALNKCPGWLPSFMFSLSLFSSVHLYVCLSFFLSVCLSVGLCLSAGASWPAFCVVYFVHSSSGLPVWLSAFEPSSPTLLSICLHWRRVLLAFFNQSHVIQCTTEKFEI